MVEQVSLPRSRRELLGFGLEPKPEDDAETLESWRRVAIWYGVNPDTELPLSSEEEAALSADDRDRRHRGRRCAQGMLAAERHYFLGRQDPSVPWRALAVARVFHVPVPEWVLANLEQGAFALFEAVGYGADSVPMAERVGRALGFGATSRGVSDPVANARLLDRYEDLAIAVLEHVESKVKKTAALQLVAEEYGTTASTVRHALAWFEREAKTWPEWSGDDADCP